MGELKVTPVIGPSRCLVGLSPNGGPLLTGFQAFDCGFLSLRISHPRTPCYDHT
ncbi:hypothetical protein ASPCADRAFT_202597, partial [Aspergillus carbonarius ITEM 5010]